MGSLPPRAALQYLGNVVHIETVPQTVRALSADGKRCRAAGFHCAGWKRFDGVDRLLPRCPWAAIRAATDRCVRRIRIGASPAQIPLTGTPVPAHLQSVGSRRLLYFPHGKGDNAQ